MTPLDMDAAPVDQLPPDTAAVLIGRSLDQGAIKDRIADRVDVDRERPGHARYSAATLSLIADQIVDDDLPADVIAKRDAVDRLIADQPTSLSPGSSHLPKHGAICVLFTLAHGHPPDDFGLP